MKLIQQKEVSDCGIACLAMILNYYYKQEIDVDQIKYENNYNNKDLSFLDIQSMSLKYGLKSEAYKIDSDFISLQKKGPFLAQVVNEAGLLHFVVVESVQDHISILNPSKKDKESLLIEEFKTIFTGKVIFFNPNKVIFSKRFQFNLLNLLKETWKLLFITSILSIIYTIIIFFEAKLIRTYLDLIVKNNINLVYYLFFFIIVTLNIIMDKFIDFLYWKITIFKENKVVNCFCYLSENESLSGIDKISLLRSMQFKLHYEINYIMRSCVNSINLVVISIISIFLDLRFFVIIIFYIILVIFVFLLFHKQIMIDGDLQQKETILTAMSLKQFKYTSKQNAMIKQIGNVYSKIKYHWINNQLIFKIIDYIILITMLVFYQNVIMNDTSTISTFFTLLILRQFIKSNLFTIFIAFSQFKNFKTDYFKVNAIAKSPNFVIIDEIKELILGTQLKFKIQNGVNEIDANINLACLIDKSIKHDVIINNQSIDELEVINLQDKIKVIDDNYFEPTTIYYNIFKDNYNRINLNTDLQEMIIRYNINLVHLFDKTKLNPSQIELIACLTALFSSQKVIGIEFPLGCLEQKDYDIFLRYIHNFCNDKFIIIKWGRNDKNWIY